MYAVTKKTQVTFKLANFFFQLFSLCTDFKELPPLGKIILSTNFQQISFQQKTAPKEHPLVQGNFPLLIWHHKSINKQKNPASAAQNIQTKLETQGQMIFKNKNKNDNILVSKVPAILYLKTSTSPFGLNRKFITFWGLSG